MTDRTVVVTGGSGFLGQAVVRRLTNAGVPADRVRVPRSSSDDLREMSACRRAVDGADVVIHLAGNVGGIGYNPFNPALAGRAFMLISFTGAMTTWSQSPWIQKLTPAASATV